VDLHHQVIKSCTAHQYTPLLSGYNGYNCVLFCISLNGAGTTTAVAQKLNRRYLGVDISEKYCKTAEDRISKTLF